MSDLITDAIVETATDLLRDELLGTTDRSRRPATSPGFRESMREALEAVAPLIAAAAWDEGYAEGSRGRMWDSTNPYRAEAIERGEP